MGTVVLDAGVVIGLLDPHDAHHAAATSALGELSAEELRLPASAYAEVLVHPTAEGTLDRARAALADFGLAIDWIGECAAEEAARFRARHRALRLPDALVLGHAEAIGADAVLTTDDRWLGVSPRVRLVV